MGKPRRRANKGKDKAPGKGIPPLLSELPGSFPQRFYGIIPAYSSQHILEGISARSGVADMTHHLPPVFPTPEQHAEFIKRLVSTKKTRYKYLQLTSHNRVAYHQTLRFMHTLGGLRHVKESGTFPSEEMYGDYAISRGMMHDSIIAWPWVLLDALQLDWITGDIQYDGPTSIRVIDLKLAGMDEECSVCLDALNKALRWKPNTITFACSHTLHFECFMEMWNSESSCTACPVCRNPINVEEVTPRDGCVYVQTDNKCIGARTVQQFVPYSCRSRVADVSASPGA